MFCVLPLSHSYASAIHNRYFFTCYFVSADPSVVPNCRYITSANCGPRAVRDRIFYKTSPPFFGFSHLFIDFPLGVTFVSILRCHSSVTFCYFPYSITTRHRIGYGCSLMHLTFCSLVKAGAV